MHLITRNLPMVFSLFCFQGTFLVFEHKISVCSLSWSGTRYLTTSAASSLWQLSCLSLASGGVIFMSHHTRLVSNIWQLTILPLEILLCLHNFYFVGPFGLLCWPLLFVSLLKVGLLGLVWSSFCSCVFFLDAYIESLSFKNHLFTEIIKAAFLVYTSP